MKSKLPLLLCLLLLASFSVQGQDSLYSYSQKRFGITFQLNSPNPDDVNVNWFDIDNESLDDHSLFHKSYSVGVAAQYKVDDETTVRLRLGRTKTYVEEYPEEMYDWLRDEYTGYAVSGEQVKVQIAPALIWEMGSNRLKLFAGFELPINLHGEYEYRTAGYALDGNRQLKQKDESSIFLPRGYSMGVGAVGGFSYRLMSFFSLGAEFSPSLLYARLSGKTRMDVMDPHGRGYMTLDENRGFTFYEQRFSVNLSYWFDM